MSFFSNMASSFAPSGGSAGWGYGLMSGLSAVSQLAGGISAFKEGNFQGKMYDQQADIAMQEAMFAARKKAVDVTHFQSQQVMDYVHSGVTIEGSPVAVLEKTRREGQQEVDALVRSGQAQAQMLKMQGAQARSGARSSLFGGLFQAGSTGLSSYLKAKQIGLYGNSSGASEQLGPGRQVGSGDFYNYSGSYA